MWENCFVFIALSVASLQGGEAKVTAKRSLEWFPHSPDPWVSRLPVVSFLAAPLGNICCKLSPTNRAPWKEAFYRALVCACNVKPYLFQKTWIGFLFFRNLSLPGLSFGLWSWVSEPVFHRKILCFFLTVVMVDSWDFLRSGCRRQICKGTSS